MLYSTLCRQICVCVCVLFEYALNQNYYTNFAGGFHFSFRFLFRFIGSFLLDLCECSWVFVSVWSSNNTSSTATTIDGDPDDIPEYAFVYMRESIWKLSKCRIFFVFCSLILFIYFFCISFETTPRGHEPKASNDSRNVPISLPECVLCFVVFLSQSSLLRYKSIYFRVHIFVSFACILFPILTLVLSVTGAT